MGDENVSDDGKSRGVATDESGHLSDSALSALLDGDLDPADRRRVEAHLDACADCRRELIESRRAVDSYKPRANRMPPRSRTRVAIGVALAAGLAAVILLLPRSGSELVPPPGTVRAPTAAGGGEGRIQITVISPVGDAADPAAKVVFTWRSTGADVYRLTLLTQSGQRLWLLETADTSAVAPPTKRLKPGAYFWRVDAIAAGIAATTGARRLRVSP